jgi:predicted MPP superfamily phosphohydrolase
VRIVVISDLNSEYGATDYRDEVKKAIALAPEWEPDIVLSGGDMVAGQTILSRRRDPGDVGWV